MPLMVPIKSLELFKFINQDLIKGLLTHLPIKELVADETLIRYGDPVKSLYIVLEGELEVYTAHFAEHLATLNFGSSVGEMSLIEDGQVASASVKAGKAGSKVLQIPKTVLEKQIFDNAELASAFYKGLCILLSKRLRLTNNLLRIKIDEIKSLITDVIENETLITKVSITRSTIENVGVGLISRLASLISTMEEHLGDLDEKYREPFIIVKNNLEDMMLGDLQSIDRITQKLDIILQYIVNIEKILDGNPTDIVKGDQNLFKAS